MDNDLKRCDELFNMGLKFNLKENAYVGGDDNIKDFYVPVLDIRFKDELEWDKIISNLKNELKRRRGL